MIIVMRRGPWCCQLCNLPPRLMDGEHSDGTLPSTDRDHSGCMTAVFCRCLSTNSDHSGCMTAVFCRCLSTDRDHSGCMTAVFCRCLSQLPTTVYFITSPHLNHLMGHGKGSTYVKGFRVIIPVPQCLSSLSIYGITFI